MTFPTLELDEEALTRALREHFGHTALRGRQCEAVQAVLAGRDILVTMPTGAGKSLLYQLPAVLLEGITLVVSPLIALMKDQVDALQARGLRASFVNSSIPASERGRRLRAAEEGRLDLLFVTPERFRSPAFKEAIPRLRVARLAVDEAHCISAWGHDFRPDYWRLGEARALLGGPPTIALTATATPEVARDIREVLGLREPLVVATGIERPNLFLGAVHVESTEEKVEHLARRVREIDGPGIVYSALIRDLEYLHEEFRRRGIRTLVYHGKLSAEERRGMQERFLASERDVVLATNAFGMGIDKADIRFVLHAQIPRTLEAWTQEVGRAGRDGQRAFCELCFFEEDLAVQQNFIGWANPSREYILGVYETLRGWGERIAIKDLGDLRDELLIKQRADNRVSVALKWLEVLGVTRGGFDSHDLEIVRPFDPAELPDFVGTERKKRANLEALLAMLTFARGEDSCRRLVLERHFGLSESKGECGACDVCTNADAWLEDLPARPVERCSEPPEPARRAGEFRRGDWVRIEGRHIGHIVRVQGEGRSLRLTVESAGDLRRRLVDPRRKRVERIGEGEESR